MGFLKSKWRLLTFIGVCLGSLGFGGWAYMASADVTENMKKLDEVRRGVEGVKTVRANTKVIEERKKKVEQANADFEKSMSSALSAQKNNSFEGEVDADGNVTPKPRTLILDKCLPKPSKAVAINFKARYVEAFDAMKARLRGRDKPTADEVSRWVRVLSTGKTTATSDLGPWGPPADSEGAKGSKKERSLPDLLREHPRARAADDVARRIYMYAPDSALGMHTKIAKMDVPTEIEIWQAQMSLWIQQDIVAVLSRMNEERAAKLKAENRADDCWVAYMPVKHLFAVRIDSKLGRGGGSNGPKSWLPSFTNINNDDKMFKVPLQIEVVVEESSLMDLVDRLCRQGFYTPVNLNYEMVKPNPLMEDYIYGEEPVVRAVIDLEAYYFRAVYEAWIPDSLKKVLKTPNAEEKP